MNIDPLPNFTVGELNHSIGTLLSRGFAPRFILHATVSKSQLKNGHLWLTLTDGTASISGVIWSSCLQKLNFRPKQEDGVEIIGKLNFWENRANLVVQVIEIRPTLSTVLRQFEIVRNLLLLEGLIDEKRRRSLPKFPTTIAILTSVPSSAYADMLRTAKERWPLAKLLIFPIPVQGDVSQKIQNVLSYLSKRCIQLGVQAIVIARGGGSREDLMVFDDEALCRQLADFPVPVVTGLGHEDDLTVADLVSDHRSATPTASIVDLMPSKIIAMDNCLQVRRRCKDYFSWSIQNKLKIIIQKRRELKICSPLKIIGRKKNLLSQRRSLLEALSPLNLLNRGFAIVHDSNNNPISTIQEIKISDKLMIQFSDGNAEVEVQSL